MTDQTARPASGREGAGNCLPRGCADEAAGKPGSVSRRSLFRAAGAGAAVLGGGTLLDACSSGLKGASGSSGGGSSSKEITIGWIHPQTGPLASFGAPDTWVTQQVMATSQYKHGIKIGGSTYKVNLKSYDSQSSPTRAGTLAKQAIQQDNVDMLFASSTPETVNEVASQAETLGVPLVCSNVPWEAWYGNLGGNPQKPAFKAKYVVMYFLGADDLANCFIPMWDRIGAKDNNHLVAGAFPNDSDGNAFRAVFPPLLQSKGYKLVMSSAYPDGTTNYSSMISQFKSSKADFFTNAPLPSDFPTMWKQSVQQGFRPRLATVAKVLLFPDDAYAMGSLAYNIATDTWWVPTLPWHSSFTGQSCQDLATAYTSQNGGKQPNANISNYTLFEIAYKAFTSVNNPHDKEEVAAALYKVQLPDAVAGPIDYTSPKNPAPGVAITPPIGIQWQKGKKYPLEAVVVDNTLLPQAKITGDLLRTF